MSEPTMRVVIVDDQQIVRDGLTMALRHVPGVDLVGQAADGEEALSVVAVSRPDVVLMDLRMPRMDGVTATRLIRESYPDVHVIVLTTYLDDDSVFPALRAGARGYLTKDAGAERIGQAIERVRRGEALLDPVVQGRLLDSFDRMGPPTPPPAGRLPAGLTAREAEVLTLIARGLSNREIAGTLVVSEATVKTHINHAFAKTGVRDRAQAVTFAYRNGLAHP
ncbi:MAG: response regulator [Intrasporangium sp.]|uniref:response regulator n=1 Tax=Intrasporangium sp. TaxID=1925024 RepID=UPI003F81AEBE